LSTARIVGIQFVLVKAALPTSTEEPGKRKAHHHYRRQRLDCCSSSSKADEDKKELVVAEVAWTERRSLDLDRWEEGERQDESRTWGSW
jgi:hypothetical protein